MNEIMAITGVSEKSDKAILQLKYDVMKEIKRYINSHDANGIFSKKASIERQRLFMDTEDNQSLASYLNQMRYTTVKEVGEKFKVADIYAESGNHGKNRIVVEIETKPTKKQYIL